MKQENIILIMLYTRASACKLNEAHSLLASCFAAECEFMLVRLQKQSFDFHIHNRLEDEKKSFT